MIQAVTADADDSLTHKCKYIDTYIYTYIFVLRAIKLCFLLVFVLQLQ